MATVYGHIGIRFVDERNEVTSAPLYFSLSDAETTSTVVTAATTVLGHVQALVDAQIAKAFLVLDIPYVGSAAAAGSQIERTGLFKAMIDTGDGARAYGIDLPSLLEVTLQTGTKRINMANVAVATFVDDLEALAGTLRFTNPTHQVVDTVPSGRLTFRKHRRVANRS